MSTSPPLNDPSRHPSKALPLPLNSQLLTIPTEIIIEILTHLEIQDIENCRISCKELLQITERPYLWSQLFERHFRFQSVPSDIEKCQEIYKKQYILSSNLNKAVYASETLHGHSDAIHFLAIENEMLISGGNDLVLKEWDLESLTCKSSTISSEAFTSLAIDNKTFILGLQNGTIGEWDPTISKFIHFHQGHTKKVIALAIVRDTLISSSSDKTINIWNLKSNPLHVFRGITSSPATAFAIADRVLISGHQDGMIGFCDLDARAVIVPYHGHNRKITSLVVANGHLISGSADEWIKSWDLKTKTCKAEKKCLSKVTSLVIAEEFLISGDKNGKIIIRDLNTLVRKVCFKGHADSITSLVYVKGKLISGSKDKTIRIWDFRACDNEIFEEIAFTFESQIQRITEYELKRFSRMPKTARKRIYEHFDAMFTHEWKNSSFTQKAQAIASYLEEVREEKRHPLLQHLGIVTWKDYSTVLKCRPNHLQKIGIKSHEDLLFICSDSPRFQKLLPLPTAKKDGDNRKVQTSCHDQKAALSALIQEMSLIVLDRIEETESLFDLLYDEECPWNSFQDKLASFKERLKAIGDDPNNMTKRNIEAINQENCNLLTDELNTHISEFNLLDQNHQIAKLYHYVNQGSILKAWTNLNANGIFTLSDFVNSDPTHKEILFQMGYEYYLLEPDL